MQEYFIAGTDTDIGKTYIACQLIKHWVEQGYQVAGIKPIAAGAEQTASGLCNDDALALQAVSNVELDYQDVNPICLPDPLSPHLAAVHVGVELSAVDIARQLQSNKPTADVVLYEGAGGWLTPINHQETIADIIKLLKLPVILVVGVRLGCLNHTLLTVQAIEQDGLTIAGWVANCIDNDMQCIDENIEYLKQQIPAPLLGKANYSEPLIIETDNFSSEIFRKP